MTDLELATLGMRLRNGFATLRFASGPVALSAETLKAMLRTDEGHPLSEEDQTKVFSKLIEHEHLKEGPFDQYYVPAGTAFSNVGTGLDPWVGWT